MASYTILITLINLSVQTHSRSVYSADSNHIINEYRPVKFDDFFQPLKQLQHYFVTNHKVIFSNNVTMTSIDPMMFTFVWTNRSAVLGLATGFSNKLCTLYKLWKNEDGFLRGRVNMSNDGSKFLRFPVGFFEDVNSLQRIYYLRKTVSTFEFKLEARDVVGASLMNDTLKRQCNTKLLNKHLRKMEKNMPPAVVGGMRRFIIFACLLLLVVMICVFLWKSLEKKRET